MQWSVRWGALLLAACSRFGERSDDATRSTGNGGPDVAAADAGVPGDGRDAATECVRKTTGFRSPSVLENFGPGATWAGLARGATQDDQGATVVVGGGAPQSAALVASGFDLGLPLSARIDGVRVRIRHEASATTVHDRDVNLTNDKTTMGSNEAKPDGWGYTYAEVEYGGIASLWSLELTPALMNAPTFGVAIAVEVPSDEGTRGAIVDVVRIDVAYCE